MCVAFLQCCEVIVACPCTQGLECCQTMMASLVDLDPDVAWASFFIDGDSLGIGPFTNEVYDRSPLTSALFHCVQDEDGSVVVLLTVRSTQVSTHKGEVCLPGGKRDEGDQDDLATALREANEELGLDPNDVEVLGRLRPFLSRHNLSVTPIVGTIPDNFSPEPNSAEVASVFRIALATFLSEETHSHLDSQYDGQDVRYHYFQHQSNTIWGLTAEILIEVAKLAFGRGPEYQQHRPGQTFTLQQRL
eukprot:evm.model.scf_1198EXC.1 EVM.evm.TU.scf_1198EXC.1   scf_1198EXC:4690-8120(+)